MRAAMDALRLELGAVGRDPTQLLAPPCSASSRRALHSGITLRYGAPSNRQYQSPVITAVHVAFRTTHLAELR